MTALYNILTESKKKKRILVKTKQKNFLIVVNGSNYNFYDKLESMVISIKLILFLLLHNNIKEILTFDDYKTKIIYPKLKRSNSF